MKKDNKRQDNSKLIKICVVTFSIILVCAVCFSISLSSGEKYSKKSATSESSSDTSSDDILEVATKEAASISDDQRKSPDPISIDEYLEYYSGSSNTVVLFARDSCQYCKLATPILENIIYESDVDLKYVDLSTLSDDDKTKLANSDDYFKEGISTPLLVVVGNNSMTDYIEGLNTKENYISFFKKYGFME